MFSLVQHEWFEPLSRRILTAMIPLLGLIFELLFGGAAEKPGLSGWEMMWGGVFLYAVYGFFFSGYYDKGPDAKAGGGANGDGGTGDGGSEGTGEDSG